MKHEDSAPIDPENDPAFALDFATSEMERIRRDVKKMTCSECFLWLPVELFESDGDVCAECRGDK